ncbi:MAG: hypothetical protein DRJ65_07330 [Acidobacteria bacterium]|nr:MAG: hypothetical protein DRJ65_07330 [Acidobacteriota bacterium]
MSSLARGQENTPSILNWFTMLDGILTDMYLVEFQVWNIVSGLPGSQVFPAVSGDWEAVTTGDGHYTDGHYYAYDNASEHGWTPLVAEPLGTHMVKWRAKVTSGAEYQTVDEDFEITTEAAGSATSWYISVQDVRDAGLLEADYSDAEVMAAIDMWQQFLERACRQWFNPRTLIFKTDGTDSDTLHFGVPIISVEYLKINDRTDEFDVTQYLVYSGNKYPDDRGNPRIKLVSPYVDRNIFVSAGYGKTKFRKGRQNQEIKGTFGYVESDGSTPKMICRALLKIVIEKLTAGVYSPTGATPPSILGMVLKEKTDGHSITYGAPGGEVSKRRPGLSGIIQDPEVLDIIKLYRAPIGIATPAHWSYS